jgi:hypothetical protein
MVRYIQAVIYQAANSEVLFSRWPVSTVYEGRTKEMLGEIDKMDPDVLLTSDPEALAEHFFGQYGIDAPRLLLEQKYRDPLEEIDVRPTGGFTAETADMYAAGQRTMKAARVTVHLPFEGRHPFVFNMRPTTRGTADPPRVHKIGHDELVVVYETTETNPDRITSHLKQTAKEIDKYLGWLKDDISRHNLALYEKAREAVVGRQELVRGHRSLEERLGIPLKRKDPPETHRVPLERRETPIIESPRSLVGRLVDPFLAQEHYEHILSVLSSMSLAMERSPSAFYSLDEEALRWWFVVALNGHYEVGAKGEVFNAGGKTDILVDWKGKNVFVAECKFWEGTASFKKAINQLFDYATWRDTKTAILMFSRNKDFKAVLTQIPRVVEGHDAYKETLPSPGSETEFRFRLRHPQDPEHELSLAVLAFNVPTARSEA